MQKIKVHINDTESCMNNLGLVINGRVISYPYPKFDAHTKGDGIVLIKNTNTERNVLIVPIENLKYIEIVDEEEELKDAFMD